MASSSPVIKHFTRYYRWNYITHLNWWWIFVLQKCKENTPDFNVLFMPRYNQITWQNCRMRPRVARARTFISPRHSSEVSAAAIQFHRFSLPLPSPAPPHRASFYCPAARGLAWRVSTCEYPVIFQRAERARPRFFLWSIFMRAMPFVNTRATCFWGFFGH